VLPSSAMCTVASFPLELANNTVSNAIMLCHILFVVIMNVAFSNCKKWNNTFFCIFIEGATEKVLQFIMPLMSVYLKNFGVVEQKRHFRTLQRVQSIKNLLIDVIFVT
jgi:hypothetical protein